MHKRGFMRAPMILSLLSAVACAGDRPPDPTPPRPLTVRDHLRAAEAQDQAAAGNQQNAETLRGAPMTWFCDDDPLATQATSGFEQLTHEIPCWSNQLQGSILDDLDALELRRNADRHRQAAAQMVAAEQAWCQGLSPEQLAETPFARRRDIAAVAPVEQDGELRGARIQFRPVAGLTEAQLGAEIGCHRARAASMGWTTLYMAYDPTVLADTEVAVTGSPDGLVVTVVAAAGADAAATLAWLRAQELAGTPVEQLTTRP